ncbi:MAG TPA: xanthine dehydrogenase family protein molybdopterin-binding subunit [Candidatus Limnocylindrales bacterium]|nr:xanthine dehydrogenase family protein molybdopterin-binding subunit [Candidatus Limnocylindrales bacterium]
MTAGPPGPIGRARPRPDASPKVRGALRYGADRLVPHLLHARPVLSSRAHARIVAIDGDAARAVPGVVAVLTAADLPIRSDRSDRMARPLARDEVLFAGEPVALVVARTPEAAADGAELVRVRLEPLPAVLDPEAAMAPDAPVARGDPAAAAGSGPSMDAQTHAAIGGEGDASIEAEALSANVSGRHRYRRGDAAGALARAAVVVEGTFRTSWVHQGYLEPQVATAWVDADGSVVVETATQGTFSARSDTARALGVPQHRVRVVPTPLGGAFGGKWPLFESLVAGAALAVGAPVRLVLERSEDLVATQPSQPFEIALRLGADAEGRFAGIEARIVADTGAFDEASAESLAAILVAGPYHWPAFDLSGYGVRTNRFGDGPYRGPSGPPSAFALETLVDELAGRLGVDPIELRRRNAVAEGEPMVDDEAWPRIGLTEVLDAVERTALWRDRGRVGPDEGIGLAVGYWPGANSAAAAACRVSSDGSVRVMTGAVDMSGVAGGFQAIVAEVLGIDPSAVGIETLDTATAPTSPGSGGSTITYSVGRAIRMAAEAARDAILQAAALQLEIAPEDLELVDGSVRPKGTPDRAVPLAKVVRANERAGRTPLEGHARSEILSLSPSVAAHLAHVRVDRETGRVDVLRHELVQDVGRVLNPALVAGQQHGAVAQAVGWALRERLVHDAKGQLLTTSFLDYALPRVEDVGSIATTSVEVPSPDGPFGAKGIGEAPVIPGPAAIANAIAAATGVRLRSLPMDPPSVWRALHAQSG